MPASASVLVLEFRHNHQDSAPDFTYKGNVNSVRTNLVCKKCGRNHKGKCMVCSEGCFGCSKQSNRLREFQLASRKGTDALHQS